MRTSLTRRFRQVVVEVPADTVVLSSYTILTTLALVVPPDAVGPIVGVAVAPLVLFVPGYALLTGLFPRAGTVTAVDYSTVPEISGITAAERLALSFGLSVVLLPVVGILLFESGIPMTRVSIAGALDSIVLVGFAWGAVRRMHVPTAERFRVPLGSTIASVRTSLFRSDSKGLALVNLVLVAAVCLWAGSFGFLLLAPPADASYSELSVLTESANGSYVASGYPSSFEAGEPQQLAFGVTNHERTETEYTVVVQLQWVRESENGLQVRQREQLGRYTRTLADGETWHEPHTIYTTKTGDQLRLTYLLYRDSPPTMPTISNSYRHGYVWVNVTAANQSAGGTSNASAATGL